jgi:hypothetical protein
LLLIKPGFAGLDLFYIGPSFRDPAHHLTFFCDAVVGGPCAAPGKTKCKLLSPAAIPAPRQLPALVAHKKIHADNHLQA